MFSKYLKLLACCLFFVQLNGAEDIAAYLVFQHKANFRTDWVHLREELGDEKLVLIRHRKMPRSLVAKEINGFDSMHLVDDFNFETLSPLVQRYVEQYGADRLKIISNDEYALDLAAQIREYFNIPGPDLKTAEKFRNKVKMKQLLQEHQIAIPKFVVFDDQEYARNKNTYLEAVAAMIGFPMFAKPIDGASSENTSKISDFSQLCEWASQVAPGITYEIDEFVEGTLYHCDTLMKEGQIIFFGMGKCTRPCFDITYGKRVGVIYLTAEDEEFEPLFDYTKQVLEALSPIPDGGTHLELFVKNNGENVFLEVAARTSGSLTPECYYKMWNVAVEDCHFKLQMGKLEKLDYRLGNYAAFILYPKQKGVIGKSLSPNIQSNNEMQRFVQEGDVVPNQPTSLFDLSARCLLWNPDKNELIKDMSYMDSFYPFEMLQSR